MQHWKFLLFGITGDNSKKYILPALSKFAELNESRVEVELIGYSRSTPDFDEIEEILNKSNSSGKHNLISISGVQSQYENKDTLINIIESLKEGERLVAYFAIPPIVFSQLLENFCLYNTENIDLLIEKPIGQNKEEALEIFNIIDKCKLNSTAHFIDHYLFKEPTQLNGEDFEAISNLDFNKLKRIEIHDLETLDVKGREGFYDITGALLDMFPSHEVTLLDLALKLNDDLAINYDSFNVKDVELGQYQSYLQDINKDISNTDTYFKVLGNLNLNNKEIEISIESGKMMGVKDRSIILTFEDGSEISWIIQPNSKIQIKSESINYERSLDAEKPDLVNMFEAVENRDYSRFFTREMVVNGWDIYHKITDFIAGNEIKPKLYKDHSWPAEYLN